MAFAIKTFPSISFLLLRYFKDIFLVSYKYLKPI
nr:MAG TPA: hypothetical protein [Caudoviricetes sp.]